MTKTQTSLLKFPCEFPIKAFGLANEAFEKEVLQIIHAHVSDLAEGAIRYKHSRDKKYLSITISITASSKQQLDTIYEALSKSPLVVMAL